MKDRAPSPPRAPTPPRLQALPVADRVRADAVNAVGQAHESEVCGRGEEVGVRNGAVDGEGAGGGVSANPSGAHVAAGVGVTTRPRAHTPQRSRFPFEADHHRARARMARDETRIEAAGRGGETTGPPGEHIATENRVTACPSGVVPAPPRKSLYQVKIKVPDGQDIVRCVRMDLNSGIPDGF